MGKALRTAGRRGRRSENEPARAVLGELDREWAGSRAARS